MNDNFSLDCNEINESARCSALYIETPREASRPEQIDVLLEKRMKEFLLARRRLVWLEEGE